MFELLNGDENRLLSNDTGLVPMTFKILLVEVFTVDDDAVYEELVKNCPKLGSWSMSIPRSCSANRALTYWYDED